MPKENREQALERIAPLLTEREVYAYDHWRSSDQPQLAPSTNAKFFNLFLQGKSCEDIRRLNQTISLGQIVAARIEGDWDALRKEHLDQLLRETSLRVQQTTLQTADFVCDLLAVANKEHGDQLRKYLQTGDPKELGSFRIDSLKSLREAVEVLQKLTGQDKQTTIHHKGEVQHSVSPLPILQANKAPSADEAARVLKLLRSASG